MMIFLSFNLIGVFVHPCITRFTVPCICVCFICISIDVIVLYAYLSMLLRIYSGVYISNPIKISSFCCY